jgi:uncharacterized SAM-binding protein YcdF (DUF218 family)
MNLDDNKLSTLYSQADWPGTSAGILIMGKRQGTKRENRQLWGRTAMAAALWYSAPQPKPYILFVASDIHGPDRKSDALVVKSQLVEVYGISADYVILRTVSNCTLIEVRAARVLKRIYNLSRIFAVTHLYHAPRTQRYLNEVLSDASVIPAHGDILDELNFTGLDERLVTNLRQLITTSAPKHFDLAREQIIEWCLTWVHRLDPRGHLERKLAKILRPGVCTGLRIAR